MYLSLICSVCEVTSGLPFEGGNFYFIFSPSNEILANFSTCVGSYGLARCVLGNYIGFMLGCAETVEYLFYVASSTVSLGGMITLVEPRMIGLEPVIYLVFYVFSLLIYIFSGRQFWRFNLFLAIISIGVVLLFCFSSLKDVNFNANAATPSTDDAPVSNPWFVGGGTLFMQVLPLSAWFFIGVETLKETCGDIPNPKINVPKGQVSCMLTLLATGLMVLFIASSLPPGILSTETFAVPFNNGMCILNICGYILTQSYLCIPTCRLPVVIYAE